MPDRHLWVRHTTKDLTFTGAAGAGATGANTIFTITGRVWAHLVSAFCLTDLAGGGTLSLGTAGDTDGFIAATTDTDIDQNDWWTAATPAAGSKSPLEVLTGGLVTSQGSKLLHENIILTIATNPTTAGRIVFDVLWTPLTDGARLTA